MRRHGRSNGTEQEKDDFFSNLVATAMMDLRNIRIQLIDRVNGEEEIWDKEGQWAYELNTFRHNELDDNDFFVVHNRHSLIGYLCWRAR